ncbi:MAG TPA: DNA alkylation repair protein [Elusimicrobia bacterium]|nr:DNA alkylation repair protein [Elusimicrobiota bacterium]
MKDTGGTTGNTSLAALNAEFKKAADPAKAKLLARYFKTGKGEYAEGDKFLGLTVPVTRGLVKKFMKLPYSEIIRLLHSPWHEHRLAALMIMVERFHQGGEEEKASLHRMYLANTRFVNNWDLVDCSAGHLVGAWLAGRDKKLLFRLARSKDLWEKRIAMVSCFHGIVRRESAVALKIARLLLSDRHDLIHKAVGWMLRELGKRCSEKILVDFLRNNYASLPRTTLRYAIERFPKKRRKEFLTGKF